VILPGEFLSDGGLHKSGERGKNVDRRVDLSVVKLSVDEDLSLCDVTGKIGDGVGDIWESEREDG